MQIKLAVVNTARYKVPARRFFVLATEKTLRAVKSRKVKGKSGGKFRLEIMLLFVNNIEMQRLNKRWRGKDKPTDVLSFPRHSSVNSRTYPFNLSPLNSRVLGKIRPMADPDGVVRLGEIVIAPSIARKEASLFGHATKKHYPFLFVHGLLHLLGYDHKKSQHDDMFMKRVQNHALRALPPNSKTESQNAKLQRKTQKLTQAKKVLRF